MRFRSIGTRLRQVRRWRAYVLVVLLAYALTVAVSVLLAPLRDNLDNLCLLYTSDAADE